MALHELAYVQHHAREQVARLHYFSINKLQDGAEIEMKITVSEFFQPPIGALQFFAQADKQTNQKVAPYSPSGWGSMLRDALVACIHEINGFPYQEES
jgi:hypothetical protein